MSLPQVEFCQQCHETLMLMPSVPGYDASRAWVGSLRKAANGVLSAITDRDRVWGSLQEHPLGFPYCGNVCDAKSYPNEPAAAGSLLCDGNDIAAKAAYG